MDLINVHSDERREIFLVDGMLKGSKEFTIIKLHKGKAIGGCVHKTEEYYSILEGEVHIKTKSPYGFVHEEIGKAGDTGSFMPNTPHMFIGRTECTLIEWGVPCDDKDTYDEEMRNEVIELNKGETK